MPRVKIYKQNDDFRCVPIGITNILNILRQPKSLVSVSRLFAGVRRRRGAFLDEILPAMKTLGLEVKRENKIRRHKLYLVIYKTWGGGCHCVTVYRNKVLNFGDNWSAATDLNLVRGYIQKKVQVFDSDLGVKQVPLILCVYNKPRKNDMRCRAMERLVHVIDRCILRREFPQVSELEVSL